MKHAGINLENVKIKNKCSILKTLNNLGPMSRKDIAVELGLSPAAVTMLTTEMIAENIICETGELQEERRAGRKKILVDIQYQSQWVIAVSIELKKTLIQICDLKANVLKKRELVTCHDLAPERFLRIIADEALAMIDSFKNDKNHILGMGVCIPGIVDRSRGISIKAYGIWQSQVAVKRILEMWMPCPVLVENNVKAFAEGELLYGAGKKDSNFLFLKWGPGVGSAVVIQNELYEGREHRAAEIGHYIIEPQGSLCKCGRRGCLETRVSTSALAANIRELFFAADTPMLHQAVGSDQTLITEEWLDDCLRQSPRECPPALADPPVRSMLGQNIERLARAVVNVITILAPDYTILFGSMFENSYIETEFLKYCQRYETTYSGDSIGKSKVSSNIYYIGAVALITGEFMFELG